MIITADFEPKEMYNFASGELNKFEFYILNFAKTFKN